MKVKQFIKEVRQKLGHNKFYFYSVDYLDKKGIINPKSQGKGIPRTFDKEDVKSAVDYYKDRV
jgi:hypothetical protein